MTADPAPPDCDVLVVGGGINGCGIARDLAGRGLRVVLAEQDDLAAHTSSCSTKLIHGGLRYLEHYDFGLVRKALAERERLLPSRGLDFRRHPAGAALQPRFTRGFAYSDGWVDDARLVVLCAVDAAARGATILTRTRCGAAARTAGHWQAWLQPRAGGAPIEVCARALVNAAGPWTAHFLTDCARLPSPRALRLVKGSHIVVPKLFDHDHAYLFQSPDGRIVFAIPYEGGFTLIGTTEVEIAEAPGTARIDAAEIDYLCAQGNRYFRRPVRAADVVWTYSGVRPLLDDEAGDASAVTRDYALDLDDDGAPLMSVWGGKITTFRKLAEEAADTLCRRLREPRAPWTADALLPGGDLSAWIGPPRRPDQDLRRFEAALAQSHPRLDPAMRMRWARAYGSRVDRIAPRGEGLGAEVAPGLYEAELDYLWRDEWARSVDDVLWRRSKLGLHYGAAEREQVRQRS